jgi:hypothetical protein
MSEQLHHISNRSPLQSSQSVGGGQPGAAFQARHTWLESSHIFVGIALGAVLFSIILLLVRLVFKIAPMHPTVLYLYELIFRRGPI